MVMKGLTWASLKQHPSLIPLFIFVGAGVVGSIFYTSRVALKSPDVMWNRWRNPEPWNDYKDKQYKFYATDRAVPTKCEAPTY